jgi:hypothetical protein
MYPARHREALTHLFSVTWRSARPGLRAVVVAETHLLLSLETETSEPSDAVGRSEVHSE